MSLDIILICEEEPLLYGTEVLVLTDTLLILFIIFSHDPYISITTNKQKISIIDTQ